MKGSELLEQIKVAWFQSRIDRRDSLLKLGGMVHEYLMTRRQEIPQEVPRNKRCNWPPQAVAHKAVGEVCTALKAGRETVNDLLRAHWLVRLYLPEGTDLGTLGYRVLIVFKYLVSQDARTGKWTRRAGCEWAEALVTEAVTQRLTVGKAKARLTAVMAEHGVEFSGAGKFRGKKLDEWHPYHQKLLNGTSGKGTNGDGTGPRPGCDLPPPAKHKLNHSGIKAESAYEQTRDIRMATQADPRDVADMLVQIIQASRDPLAVKRELALLLGELQAAPPKPRPTPRSIMEV